MNQSRGTKFDKIRLKKMKNSIDTILNNLNWKYERLNETTIVSGFKGKDSAFTFFIFYADEWIVFLSYANLLPIPKEKISIICEILAKLNSDIPFVKFSIDEKSNIIISIEWPIDLLNGTLVEISLGSLCTNTEILFEKMLDYQERIDSGVSS